MNQHQVKRDSMSQVSEDALLYYMYKYFTSLAFQRQ